MRVFYVFWGPGAPETSIIIEVLGTRCAYFACLEAPECLGPCNDRGLRSNVCAFYAFGCPGAPKATFVVGGSEARSAYFTCLEALGHLKPL